MDERDFKAMNNISKQISVNIKEKSEPVGIITDKGEILFYSDCKLTKKEKREIYNKLKIN